MEPGTHGSATLRATTELTSLSADNRSSNSQLGQLHVRDDHKFDISSQETLLPFEVTVQAGILILLAINWKTGIWSDST